MNGAVRARNWILVLATKITKRTRLVGPPLCGAQQRSLGVAAPARKARGGEDQCSHEVVSATPGVGSDSEAGNLGTFRGLGSPQGGLLTEGALKERRLQEHIQGTYSVTTTVGLGEFVLGYRLQLLL